MYIYHYSPTIVSCKIYGNIKFSTRIQKNNHKTVNYIIKHIKYEIIYRNKIKIYRLYLDILMYYTTTRIHHFLYLVENIEKAWKIYHFFIHLYRVKGFRKLRSIYNTLIVRLLNTVILYLTCI